MERTPEFEHERLAQLAGERDWIAPPRRPGPGECCDQHCNPCIWDYYERALIRWRERHGVVG